MTDPIETHYRNAYTDNIRLQAMHMRSHLRNSCDFEPSRGEFLFLDSYGVVNDDDVATNYVRLITDRNTANKFNDVPRARRRLAPKFWEFTEYFDPRDKVKLLRDIRPDSNWTRAVVGAFGRQMDREIIAAFDANAEDEAGSSIAFEATSENTIAGTVGANTGMNVDKTIQMVNLLWANLVQDDVPWFSSVFPAHITQLFSFTNDDRLLSQDFSGMNPLKSGKIGTYMGVEHIPTTEILSETLPVLSVAGRFTYTYSMDSMVFSMDGQVEVHFDVIAHLKHALQVAHYATFSATRMHEGKIVRTECATTAV